MKFEKPGFKLTLEVGRSVALALVQALTPSVRFARSFSCVYVCRWLRSWVAARSLRCTSGSSSSSCAVRHPPVDCRERLVRWFSSSLRLAGFLAVREHMEDFMALVHPMTASSLACFKVGLALSSFSRVFPLAHMLRCVASSAAAVHAESAEPLLPGQGREGPCHALLRVSHLPR